MELGELDKAISWIRGMTRDQREVMNTPGALIPVPQNLDLRTVVQALRLHKLLSVTAPLSERALTARFNCPHTY